ncbi:MAG TPA: rod shape-determining protein MreC [Gaiellaceae bacterium]|nr:rod shape-determining protein MreC [Gaiellaceae bacterium]
MARNRTARVAVLGSSVQKSAGSGYPSNRSSAVRRRFVVGVLVLASLVLITVSFRSSALDSVQGTGASILRPFEVAANRVARPFRDAAGWTHGLVDARSQNKKLRRENAALQQQVLLDEQAIQENVQLRAQLSFKGAPALDKFDRVNTEVLTNPQSPIDASVTIAAGKNSGVADGDVVVSPTGGLVGIVDKAYASISRVTLLTDEQSSVTATDLTSPTAVGEVHRGGGSSNVLVLDRVPKSKYVGVGDKIITAGTLGKGALPSMFPRGILVGTVTSESDTDVNPFKTIQVQAAVDFSSLQSVIVLAPRK